MRCLKPNAIRKGAAVRASFLRPRSLKAYIALVPIIAGLALSHTAMIVAGFSGLTSGFEVLRGGLGTCIAAVPMLAAMVMLYKTKGPLSEKAVDAAFFVSIIVQSGSIIAFGSITLEGPAASAISTGLSAVCSLASWIAILTWLRHIQAASSFTAVLVAFGALSVAQPVLYAFMLLPPDEACLIAGILAVLQAPLALYIHKRNSFEHFAESANTGYFGFEGAKTDTPRLFLTMTLSVFALSLAMGVVEGSPFRFIEGSARLPDVGYVAVTTAVTVGIIIGAAWRPRTMMTTGIWILMQGLGITALLFYVAFPERLSIGAALSTTLSAVMTGLVWYLIMAFSHYGTKDPFFYGLAGWLAYLVPRAIVQIIVGHFPAALLTDPLLLTALTGAMMLASTQFVFIRLLKTAYSDAGAAQENTQRLEKLLGLKGTQLSSASMRKELILHDAEKLKEEFGLSDREAEVIALYALGKTQQAIAEDLSSRPQPCACTSSTSTLKPTCIRARKSSIAWRVPKGVFEPDITPIQWITMNFNAVKCIVTNTPGYGGHDGHHTRRNRRRNRIRRSRACQADRAASRL